MAHDFKLFPELTNSQMERYYFESPHKQIVDSFRAEVVKVIDVDTIRVEVNFRDFDFPIRLINIAGPEIDEGGGVEGQEFLSSKILGEEIYILVNPKIRVGKWGRLLGEIIHKGLNLNNILVDAGYAVDWKDRATTSLPNFDRQLEVLANG